MKHSLDIADPSSVAEGRRLARQSAGAVGLDSDRIERLSVVATEAGTNLLRHAGGGRLLIQQQPGARIALAAIDRGPGIPETEAALTDGYSTAGGAGTGLGAMRRLSDRFALHSTPGRGTTVLCEFGSGPGHIGGIEVGAFLMNYPRNPHCGDAWTARNVRGRVELLVLDGLGHGPRAEAAGQEAIEAFARLHDDDPSRLLGALSADLSGTRGSVGCLAQIEAAEGALALAGVGNISALMISPTGDIRRMISREGRLGGAVRPAPVERAEMKPGDTLVLHSDGIASLRELPGLPSLLRQSCAVVAATLMRDHARGTDDAAVLVARLAPKTEAP